MLKAATAGGRKERYTAFKRAKDYRRFIIRNNVTEEAMEHHVGSIGGKMTVWHWLRKN